jgi:hypothetical protein
MPCHSPDKAMPSYYTKNESFASGISKLWCVSTFTMRGVCIWLNGASTDLERPVWRQVVAGRSGGSVSTDSGFSSSCRRVATKVQAKPPQTLAGRPRSWADRPAPRPTRPGVWPTWSMCQIHPRGDDDFDIWSTSLCHPLKCSNLVPMFLKSNKH